MDFVTGALLGTAVETSSAIAFDVSIETFHRIVQQAGECLVVHIDQFGKGKRHFYIVTHRGYRFVASTDRTATFGAKVELIESTKMIEDVATHVNSRWS